MRSRLVYVRGMVLLALLFVSGAQAAVPADLEPGTHTNPKQRADIAHHFKTRARIHLDPVLYADGFAKPDWWAVALRDEPDRVLRHEFAFFSVWRQFPADIDWNGMIDKDRETIWWLNRFFFLIVLQEADEGGGDPKYARKGIELMLDWVAKCPAARAKALWGPWRPLEIGLRLNNWCRFLDYVARRGIVEPDELCILLGSVREQAQYLASVTGPGRGNHGFMENCGLGVAALVFPELKGAGKWIAAVWKNFKSDVRTQVYPDGSHIEMSPIYEFTCLRSTVQVAYLAQQRREPVPPTVLEKIRAMNRYLAFIQKPDGTLPAFNDGDRCDLNKFFAFVARWQNQSDVLWVATRGKAGSKPASAHFFASWSGLAIFRTGWGPDAQSLLLDAGPFGTGHQHHDALQVEYSAFGQDFLVEPGRYTYRNDPIRRYLVSTHAHCTITVDGGGQRSHRFRKTWRSNKPIDVGFKADGTFGYARGVYSLGYEAPGAEKITHRRSVFFVPKRYAVIYDLVDGRGEHEVGLHWSFPPLEAEKIDAGTVAVRGDNGGLLLRTSAAGPAELETKIVCGQRDPPAGWFSEVYGRVQPAPHVTTIASVALPARFVTLLYPYRLGPMPKPTIEIDPSADERVRVSIDGKTDHLSPAGIN